MQGLGEVFRHWAIPPLTEGKMSFDRGKSETLRPVSETGAWNTMTKLPRSLVRMKPKGRHGRSYIPSTRESEYPHSGRLSRAYMACVR